MRPAAESILQNPDELDQLLDLYQAKQPRRILEIGTYLGGTLWHWLAAAPVGATVVAVDLEHQHPDAYVRWMRADTRLVLVEGDSHDLRIVEEVSRFGPFDWVFIDADHHESSVRLDWRTYSALAAPAAIVALHDITPTDDPTIDVAPLWAELRAEHDTIELVEPGGFGIGVVVTPALVTAAVEA